MGKLKMPKGSPTTDMTPLVDLGFLLVTFFMLSAKFRVAEPVVTDPPYAATTDEIPEHYVMVTVSKEGKVFFDMSGKAVRQSMLELMAEEKYPTLGNLNEDQVNRFLGLGSFGVPVAQLPAYLDADETVREQMNATTAGIPIDSLNNELADWISFAFKAFVADARDKGWSDAKIKADGLCYAIKADGNTDYKKVEDVIDVFRKINIFKFNMVANMEKDEGLRATRDEQNK
ncbi:MAG: biopolymer transporter ExbD [Flavobacteriales bacterium]